MGARQVYRDLCLREPSLPLFSQAWWLDATCGVEGWDVALVIRGSEVHAALPYSMRRARGFLTLSQPQLTPYLGPWLGKTGARRSVEYGRQKDLMIGLIDALPKHDNYMQRWDPSITNWLPFYWRGFQQTTTYTYAITDLTDMDQIWGGFRDNIRKEIRKARDREGLKVVNDISLDDILALQALTYSRQGKKPPYSDDYLRGIDAACSLHECCRSFAVQDSEGRLHAGLYVVWDSRSVYCLVSGGDPELRSKGGMSLCIWEAIRFAAGVAERFDFCGSMIEPFERFFRAFGAEQVPSFHVSRTPSRLLAGLQAARSLVRGR